MVARAGVGEELFGDHLHGGAGAGEADLLDPGFAVDAKAKFGMAGGDAVLFRAAGNGAGVQRHADGHSARDHRPRPSIAACCGESLEAAQCEPAAHLVLPKARERESERVRE